MDDGHSMRQTSGQGERGAFVDRFGGVYEHSPWVAETVFDKGLGDDWNCIGALSDRMAAAVDQAEYERQLELLRAHPDLAGRLALQGELTEASSEEQKSAGLNQCTPDELSKFQTLNQQYTEKFGFPFILAVSGRNRAQILENFELRVGNSPKEEFATALHEVHNIARIRLAKILSERK